jgi:hypothetical protein
MNSIDAGLQFQKLIWLGVIMISAVFVGALLAQDAIFLAVLCGMGLWVMLLPYHTSLATVMSVATFGSALILPFPGRPYWWEFAAMLAWSGLILTVALRKQSPDAGRMVRRHKWLFVGALLYCATLVMIMYVRGVGFRALGGAQMGGRLYFQQLLCAIFPLLFAMRPLSKELTIKLFTLQCLLSSTFLVSDFVFSSGTSSLWMLLYFFELPNDSYAFASMASSFGIKRFQSLYIVAQAMMSLLLVRHRLQDYVQPRTAWLWPVTIGIIGVGLLGGHRYLLVLLFFVLLISAWAQRFFSMVRSAVMGVLLLAMLAFVYAFAQELPLSAQRTLSLLPGIEVNRVARDDGDMTWVGRQEMRRLGWELAPQYKWIGRGFRKNDPTGSSQEVVNGYIDPDTFYNGFIGLLVNTGWPGTGSMLLFLGAGTAIAMRILFRIRRMGVPDPFSRLCCVLAAQWVGGVIIFLFLHGDSEFAMRSFSLQAALLMCCEYNLRNQHEEQAQLALAEAQA